MVNIANLNYLPIVAQWTAQIPRLEDGWWPNGGAVDPANDSGILNWQPQLLAGNAAYLKAQIEGAGIGLTVGAPAANLNTLAATGTYRAAADVTGAPVAATALTVEHRAGADANTATQEAWSVSSDRSWVRRKVGGVWQAWREVGLVTDALFGAVVGATGLVRHPSGVIMQWGTTPQTDANGVATVVFAQAFPNAVWHAFATERTLAASGLTSIATVGLNSDTVTLTGATFRLRAHDGTARVSDAASYFVIGY